MRKAGTCSECSRHRPIAAKGLCSACYKRGRPPHVSEIACRAGGCTGPHSARGFCKHHYERLRRWGTPYGGLPPATEAERFERLIDKNGPLPSAFRHRGACWLWRRKPAKSGYGVFTPSRQLRCLAHRYSYELYVGPIPAGLVIDHLCRNRMCVNPRHLEPVTTGENTRRGLSISTFNALKTECPAGHAYTPENTYHPKSKPNARGCIACRRMRDRTPARLARKRVRKAA